MFDFIALFSPTSRLDVGWKQVFEYMEKELGQKLDDPLHPSIFENFKGEDLDRIVGDQFKIIKKLKSNPKGGALPNILIIADDVADQPEAVRRSNFVGAFVKYRHAQVSTIILTQKWKLLHPAIRVNATAVFCTRLRNVAELHAFIEEISAHHGYKNTMAIYKACVDDAPYSFMYVDLLAHPPKFYCRFEKEATIE